MFDLEQVVWPDPNSLLVSVGGCDQLAAMLPSAETHRAGLDLQVASADGRTSEHTDVAIRLATADEELTFQTELQFPVTLADMRDIVRAMTEAMLLFLAYRSDVPSVRSDDELFALVGPDGFVDWMSSEVVGESASFDCKGYALEDEGGRKIGSGVSLDIDFHGSAVAAELPFPHGVAALCKFGSAASDLAIGEYHRANFAYPLMYQDVLTLFPFMQEDVESYAESLTRGQSVDQASVRDWASRRTDGLWRDCPLQILEALELIKEDVTVTLTDAVLAEVESFTVESELLADHPSSAPAEGSAAPAFAGSGRSENAVLAPPSVAASEVGPPTPQSTTSTLLASRPHLVPASLSVFLLIAALGAHPYVYYQWLRVIVCGTCCFIVGLALHWQSRMAAEDRVRAGVLVAGCGVLALLFNPVAPVTLARSTWALIDLVAAAWIVGAVALVRRPQH